MVNLLNYFGKSVLKIINNVKNIKNKDTIYEKIVLLINVDDIKFNYKKIKNLIEELFAGTEINLQVEDFEEVEFEENEEDISIDIVAFNYDCGEDGKHYSVQIQLENIKTEKNIEFQISEKGKMTQKSFYKALNELLELTKYSIEKKILTCQCT